MGDILPKNGYRQTFQKEYGGWTASPFGKKQVLSSKGPRKSPSIFVGSGGGGNLKLDSTYVQKTTNRTHLPYIYHVPNTAALQDRALHCSGGVRFLRSRCLPQRCGFAARPRHAVTSWRCDDLMDGAQWRWQKLNCFRIKGDMIETWIFSDFQ